MPRKVGSRKKNIRKGAGLISNALKRSEQARKESARNFREQMKNIIKKYK